MIEVKCRTAATAARAGDIALAKRLHAQCPGGTWCDCQHVVEPVTPEPARHASTLAPGGDNG
jgi:hypothetical protein